MNPTESHADRVRRWFATPLPPEPPTDDEIIAFATHDFEAIDHAAVAAAITADPCAERRLAEIQRHLDRPSVPVRETVPVPVPVPSLPDLALAWLRANGKSLAASLRVEGGRIKATLDNLWSASFLPEPALLVTRGLEPTPPPSPGAPAVLRLRGPNGQVIVVRAGPRDYNLELDLNDSAAYGTLHVRRVDLPNTPAAAPFKMQAQIVGGRATVSRCPAGLLELRADPHFELHLLLEPLPGTPPVHPA